MLDSCIPNAFDQSFKESCTQNMLEKKTRFYYNLEARAILVGVFG